MENPETNVPKKSDSEIKIKKCCLVHWRGTLTAILPLVFLIAMFINCDPPYRCLYMIIGMSICWVAELFPLPITAMLPILAFPLMNILVSDLACSLYFKDTLVTLLLSLMVGATMEYTNLHNRLAALFCILCGMDVWRTHRSLVPLTLLLTFWVPNTVCAAFMYPLTHAILEQMSNSGYCTLYENDDPAIPKNEKQPSRVAICYYLSVAYASSIGGFAAVSSTYAVYTDMYNERFPKSPDEIDIPYYGMIPMLLSTLFMALCMQFTHLGLFRPNSPDAQALEVSYEAQFAGRKIARENFRALGAPTMAQATVAIITVVSVILIFVTDPSTHIWDLYGKTMNSSTVLSTVMVILFSLPATCIFLKCWDVQSAGKSMGLITWKFVNTYVPWQLIFIIGCGGTIAEGSRKSGLARKLGDFFTTFRDLPAGVSLLFSTFITLICTNFTVNSAVMRVIGPGILEMGVKSKIHPLYFLLPNGVLCSCAFLMPTATGPNAIMAAFANIKIKQMFFAGILPTLTTWLIVYICAVSWAYVPYPDITDFPKWIAEQDMGPNYGDADE